MLFKVESNPYQDPNSLESRFRRARFARVVELVSRTLAAKGRCRILDLGGTELYWRFVKDQVSRPGVHIVLCNLTAEPVEDAGLFTSVAGNACDLAEHADGSFDLVHSNSVIEHVGGWGDMKRMAANVRRLAPAYYVQTPYFWFPVEPHFRSLGFHWLPEQMRYRKLMRRRYGFTDKLGSLDEAMQHVDYCRLLDRAQMAALFPDARLHDERFMGLTKSLMAIREAA